jgi:hypothetical protein
MFKLQHLPKSPRLIQELFQEHTNTSSITTRSTVLFNLPTVRTNIGDKAFSQFAARLWNELAKNPEILATTNYNKFSLLIYTKLLNEASLDP